MKINAVDVLVSGEFDDEGKPAKNIRIKSILRQKDILMKKLDLLKKLIK